MAECSKYPYQGYSEYQIQESRLLPFLTISDNLEVE